MTVDCAGQDAQCSVNCQATVPPVLISGPRRQVNLSGSYAFISAPVDLLNSSAANIYGTILGGNFKSSTKVHIYSMAAAKVGLPGIGSAETLANFTALFQQAGAGVSVPLNNLPIVYQEGVSK